MNYFVTKLNEAELTVLSEQFKRIEQKRNKVLSCMVYLNRGDLALFFSTYINVTKAIFEKISENIKLLSQTRNEKGQLSFSDDHQFLQNIERLLQQKAKIQKNTQDILSLLHYDKLDNEAQDLHNFIFSKSWKFIPTIIHKQPNFQ